MSTARRQRRTGAPCWPMPGHGTAEDMTEFVEYVEDPLLGYLSEERYAALDTLFEHRVLTHRLTEAEIKSAFSTRTPI